MTQQIVNYFKTQPVVKAWLFGSYSRGEQRPWSDVDILVQYDRSRPIDQLMDEGVAQLFVNQFNNRKIIGTVGQLQFEVIQYRLENEYNAKCRWEPVHLYKACWIESDDPKELENFKKRKYQYMAKDKEGRDVFLADSGYVLSMAQQDFEHIKFHFTSEF